MSTDAPPTVGLHCLNDVRRKEIVWRVPGLIPAGMLSVIAGEQGTGKGLLICAWAASLTRRGLPVVLAAMEDSPAYSLRPRMQAAGADMRLVHTTDPFVLPDGATELAQMIHDHKPAWFVLDPITEYLSALYSSYSDHAVRQALAPLELIAERYGTAITWVQHLTKGQSSNALIRISGSAGFTALARSVVLFARDPNGEDPSARYLVHTKCNIAPCKETESWSLEPIVLPETIEEPRVNIARVVPVGTSELTAEHLLGQAESAEEKTDLEKACELIREQLFCGPMLTRELMEVGNAVGFSQRTMERARKSVGVIAVGPTKKGGPWSVALPVSQSQESANGGLLGTWRTLNPNEQAVSESPDAKSPPLFSVGGLYPENVSQSPDLGTASLDDLHDHFDSP